MKITFILLIIILSINILKSQTINFGGHISNNTTWNADTVKITGDVIIDNNKTLTINAGTFIEFQAHYMIYVNGTILANGLVNDTVTFTSADTTGFNNELDIAGSWYGIKFINTNILNDSSKISYCKIEYVKDIPNQDSLMPGGAIIINNFSKLTINNCKISNNNVINEFAYLGNGGALTITENSNPIIRNNTFSNNFASANGGAIYCNKSNPNIVSNVFFNNKAGNNTAGTGGAISLNFCADYYTLDTIASEINNNLIYKNSSFKGGGIYTRTSSANFINNTICNNNSNYGGGLYSQKCNPLFINTILFYNTATEGNQVYINRDASLCTPGNNPDFINSDLEGGYSAIKIEHDQTCSGLYENNFDTAPLFINVSLNNYNLQNTSALINKGKIDYLDIEIPEFDLAGNPRIYNDTIDIGAFENNFVNDIEIITSNNNFTLYPNPTTGYFTITTDDIINISIINSVGKLVKNTNAKNINLSNFKRGIYFVKITTSSSIITKKLILE